MPAGRISKAAEKLRIAAIGYRKIREKDRIAKDRTQDFRDFFLDQRDLVLERFAKLEKYFEQEPASGEVKTNKAAPLKQAALDKWIGQWGAIEKATTEELQDLIVDTEMDGMQAGGDLLAGNKVLNPGGKFWDLENPRAVKWFQKNGGSLKYIKGIQDTTADSLKTVITTALDEGWSYNDTAKEIRKLFDGPISRDRAKLIAVTEAAHAYEAGNREFGKSLQDEGIVMEKSWQNSGDGKVSDGCLENTADGWIPIDEPHTSGDQNPPRFPGCRCWEIYRQAPKNGGD